MLQNSVYGKHIASWQKNVRLIRESFPRYRKQIAEATSTAALAIFHKDYNDAVYNYGVAMDKLRWFIRCERESREYRAKLGQKLGVERGEHTWQGVKERVSSSLPTVSAQPVSSPPTESDDYW
jgi:hypothetical protein